MDLIITTIPLASPVQIPTLRISIILNQHDLSNLRNKISEIQNQKKKRNLKNI